MAATTRVNLGIENVRSSSKMSKSNIFMLISEANVPLFYLVKLINKKNYWKLRYLLQDETANVVRGSIKSAIILLYL